MGIGMRINKIARVVFGLKVANKIKFLFKHGYVLNYDAPLGYSEWINKYKIDFTNEMVVLSDKVLVKYWLIENGFSNYILKNYFEYDFKSSIDLSEVFHELPKDFVVKSNSGAGNVIVVKDKREIDLEDIERKVESWRGEDFLSVGYEKHYDLIDKIIFAEEFISSNVELTDYKFHCFPNGEIIVAVYTGRFSNLTTNYFNEEWEEVFLEWADRPLAEKDLLLRPARFDEALSVVKDMYSKLSARYVRIDMYILPEKIVFGEFTFTPGAGFIRFKTPCSDRKLGLKMVGEC